MKLIVKFNILLLAVFGLGLAASYYYADDLLQANAVAEVQGNARIMMESALAVRDYTNTQITPLLTTQLRYKFMPQSIPSYSAVDWEVDIVNHFAKNADAGAKDFESA